MRCQFVMLLSIWIFLNFVAIPEVDFMQYWLLIFNRVIHSHN